jgi:hypothetical protein
LLGFIGPKAEAEQIKARLATFLRETLGLELNQDKTLITHARTDVPQIFRTGDPIGFSPERNGIECQGNRKGTLLNLRSRPPRRW